MGDLRIYVDLATGHEWKPIRPGVTEFHMIDMDLDVIRSVRRGVFVDDEDEFAEHRLQMNYPADVVHRIRSASDQLYQAVKAQDPPFDGTDREWFRKGRA